MSFSLRLGDCLDSVTGLASLPDKSVDHVITDPPYEAEAHTLQRRVKRGAAGVAVVEALDFVPIDESTRIAAASHMVRVCRGWLLVFCQAEAVASWRRCLEEAGASWRRPMVWVKPDGQPCLVGDRPGMGYESIAAAWAGDGRSRWNGGGKLGVYSFTKSDAHRTGHPTQKPIALMDQLVRDFTVRGETILDPFAGSGTTGVAAIRNGRAFIGWERDPKYQAVALRRLSGTHEQAGLFEGPRPPKPEQRALFGGDE